MYANRYIDLAHERARRLFAPFLTRFNPILLERPIHPLAKNNKRRRHVAKRSS